MTNTSQIDSQYFNNDVHLNDESIALYVDALKLDKPDALPEIIVTHVADCAECKTAVFELDSLVTEDFGQTASHPFFDQTKANVPSFGAGSLLRIAAVLVLTILGGAFIYTLLQKSTESEIARDAEVPRDSLKIIDSSPQLAENFIVSPNLEDLLAEAVRADELEVLSPKFGADMVDSLRFTWQGAPGSPLTLKILNNREEVLFSYEGVESPFVFSESPPSGLYYWKLETEDELLHVGKFFIQKKAEQ